MEYIFATSDVKPGLSAQKFHQLLAEGLALHKDDCCVQTLSAIPITPASHKRRFWWLPLETVDGIKYTYIPTINLPIIKNLFVFIAAFYKAIFWILCGGRKGKFAVCDILNVAVTAAALLACKLTGAKAVAIVTDLPGLMVGGIQHGGWKSGLYNMITSDLMFNYDGYILLTEQMNKVVNIRNKPYLIMEGLVDVNMAASDNRLENKAPEKIVIYAGGIYEKYGVKKLIDAFMRLKGDNLRLHIYGDGEMAKDMPEYMKQDKRVVYFGVVPNKEVVKKQLQATLLVNPRSSTEEFTKYSFPSKNMEYMASGTPILTTPLPGMPKEYYPFVYVFDDESVDGFEKTLRILLSKPKEELHEFGRQAKQFVLTYKDNRMQADRLLSLFDKIHNSLKE